MNSRKHVLFFFPRQKETSRVRSKGGLPSSIQDDTCATDPNGNVVTSTLLLQEDGQLAAKLDDVVHLIDGLLKPVRTPRARLAQTRSVLELVHLVLDPNILQAVELSSQRLNVRNKLKLLLVRLKDTSDEMSRLSGSTNQMGSWALKDVVGGGSVAVGLARAA
ncbi:hypothetical protein PPTG_12812 [Phytophthora nicotianae INRA-310]|uniref:Uncharacterized protein n=1 Tax=Phytophthora nicotianae (strain INRA-310) TaxID=761204 RepID=W2Q1R1_PHYN3|nr:hypothetical protein PPTG_12812 [Phytophthora nicotianae INRA-310]ETN06786.1 hypothetical protein PPTG_12812 [Phytophthora nicotianae INRA-310]